MERKDEFTDWLKEKILSNPEEPAAGGWDQIAESLDLEETWEEIGQDLELEEIWEKVDMRLHRYGFLQLFERISYAISGLAAIALLFGLWWGIGLATENSRLPVASAPEVPVEAPGRTIQATEPSPLATGAAKQENQIKGANSAPIKGQELAGASNAQSRRKNIEAFSSPTEMPFKRKDEAGASVKITNEQGLGPETQPPFIKISENNPDDNDLQYVSGRPFVEFQAVLPVWGTMPAADSLLVAVEPEESNNSLSYSLFPAMEAGLGSAVKLSWLVNNKTLHALEKSSLVTAVPAIYSDFFLTYGIRIHPNFMLQADGYLLDWSGQRYHEYRNGAYGEVEDKLLYRSLGISIKKAGRQLTYSSMPLFSQLNAGIYGGVLKSAQEHSVDGAMDTRNRYGKFHFGLQAGYGYELYVLNNLLLNYGVRGRLDLFNIYSGTAAVPAHLRKTRNASLDFVISLKYVLKK